ncbi:hemagglutinin repeat-containing protein [Rheinheimera sp. EpRS3]|uniref:hemagglutinin repeat-containing protein n=1 Tax=Rheinheimera sp. EpRS3 TaxID=1712383 RepID=UPI00074A4D8D|nr:hemagglutinin repeat-containing protein [Rheinheimera sp. EpRS3]KUM52369.1 hypothetical protein AR688_08690 [Rheinheimera sp. EpRS3]
MSSRSALRKLRALAFFKTGLTLQGSKFSAAGDISLNAGNDVLLGAVEKLSGHEKYFKGGHDIELHRTYDVVSFDAGGNLSVVAGNNLQSEGAQFNAGGIAALAAGNDMNLLAVVESHYDADKTTKKSTFKKKVTETVSLHEEVQGTSITAGNILLNATVDEAGNVVELPGGNITMVGSNLNAEQNIIAFGNDITVTAGTYQDYAYSHTSKSSFGGLKSKSREELAQDALLAGSELTAGGNILLNAGNDIAILASELNGDNIGLTAFNEVLVASGEESSIRESRSQSGGFFSGGSLFSSKEALSGLASITADSSVINASGNIIIDAGSATVIGSVLDADKGISVKTDIGDIQVLAARETTETYSREQNISVSFGDALKALTRPDELLKAENGQLKLSLGSATYDKVDFASNATHHKASELNAGEGIQLDSVADIKIEGSAINAQGNVNLIAGGDVVVKEATGSYSETLEEVHGKAEISLVVQHQAVEVAKAAMAVDDAKDQVKQAEADYRKYQKEKDQLETTLAQLEADYQNKVPGVNYSDIVELRNLLDDVKGDEAWYVAGIATASANLVSKSTLLVQQTAAAAQSGATYGFNAGLQLDIAASKTDSSLDATSSVASTINGNNINIVTGGDGQSGNTLIQGSALNANQNLNIFTGELNVLASQDTQRSETDTQSGSMTIAQTVWGAAGGPTVNASLNSSQQQDKQTTHTNSSLTADNLNIVTTGDANIIGGNLHGASSVYMDIGGDLLLESVQDRFSGSNKGFGISGGAGFDGSSGDTSSVNGGINASNGRYQTTETVLSSITGGAVNIDVNGHTQLTGALIAAQDAQGNDTGNLSLNTGSFNFTDLSNRSYSSNQSFGISGSVGVSDAANPADPNQSNTDLALNSSNYSYQNQSSQSLDKTLATVGQGNITVGGNEVEPQGLNRDVDAINKELYAVDRQQGNIDLTVDHRLLTEEGREQIAQDAEVVQEAVGDVAHNLGLNDITQFLYNIDNPNVSAALKDNAEKTLDLLIASGVDPAVAKALLTNPAFYSVVGDILTNGDAIGDGKITPAASSGSDNQSSPVPGEPIEILITGVKPTPLQKVLLGMNNVKEFVSGLPAEEAQAAMIGLGLLTGGVIKTAVDVAKDIVVDTALGEQIRDLQQSVAKVVAAGATGVDVDTHERFLGIEVDGGFSTNLQAGSEFGLEVLGLGAGIGFVKKGDGASSPLPEGYQRNTDGTITGPGGGKAVDTGYAVDGQTVYQRQGESGNGSYYTIDADGKQQPIKSPRPKTDIGEKRDHHNAEVADIGGQYQNKGDVVVYDGSVTGNCGTTCKPDIFHMGQDGSMGFIEVKTGNAGLSTNQSKVFEQVGVDASGKPQYRIPPDAVPSGKLAKQLDARPGQTFADLGYPNGIPVKIVETDGIGG